jgi:hypothetical protein
MEQGTTAIWRRLRRDRSGGEGFGLAGLLHLLGEFLDFIGFHGGMILASVRDL